jgi:hypothetical protein
VVRSKGIADQVLSGWPARHRQAREGESYPFQHPSDPRGLRERENALTVSMRAERAIDGGKNVD